MSLAIIPVKHLSKGKSRLAPRLPREALERLSLAMLQDIIAALLATPSVDRIAVVTPDASVAECAEAAGAIGLLRDDPGLNESIDAAARELATPGEPTLVILGDVAGATATDLESMFASLHFDTSADANQASVVIAASTDGGTAAMLRAPGSAIASHFGPQSCKAHRELASEADAHYVELELASLAIDLDHPQDVDDFLATEHEAGGSETRRIFKELNWKTP